MNKKGIIFSLIAIGLASLFILLFSSGFTEQIGGQNEVVRTRISNLDQTIEEFYTYTMVAQQVAGQQALAALYDAINTSTPRKYLVDFEDNFTRCMNNSDGCVNNQPLQEFLDNYTQAVEETQDAIITYNIISMSITHESYWSFTLTSNISIVLDDRYAKWEYGQIIESRIPTTGAYDPAFLELSDMYGAVPVIERRIASSPFNKELQTINISTFMDFYTIGQYQYSDEGSCLSQRFEGDFGNPAPGERCGIESVINPNDFPGLGGNIVHLDWQAINGITYPCANRYNITSVNQDLHLWEDDTLDYGVFPPYSVRC